jgi:hypothetical protein
MIEQTVGILALTLPILLIGYLLLRRMMPVYWFLVALVLLGTGYLVVTGAAVDVGRAVMGIASGVKAPAPKPAG